MRRKGVFQIIGALILIIIALIGIVVGLIMFKIKIFGDITQEYRISTLSPSLFAVMRMVDGAGHYGYETIPVYLGKKSSSQRLSGPDGDSNTPSYVNNFPGQAADLYEDTVGGTIEDDCYGLIKIGSTGSTDEYSFIKRNCPSTLSGVDVEVFFAPIALPYNDNTEKAGLVAWVRKKV